MEPQGARWWPRFLCPLSHDQIRRRHLLILSGGRPSSSSSALLDVSYGDGFIYLDAVAPARLIQRTPSISDLNEVIFGQKLLDDATSLGTKTTD